MSVIKSREWVFVHAGIAEGHLGTAAASGGDEDLAQFVDNVATGPGGVVADYSLTGRHEDALLTTALLSRSRLFSLY